MLAVSAALFTGYLLAVQLVMLDTICEWCVATDALTGAIALLALLRFVSAPPLPASARCGEAAGHFRENDDPCTGDSAENCAENP